MEKLILEQNKDDFYILEVNDKGDTIEFDLTDISLAEKIMNASEKIKEIDTKTKEKVLEMDKKTDNKIELTKEIIKLEKEQAKEMRKAFDSFLGDGACQKIFGDKNRYGQFDELMEALQPHFNKMIMKLDKAKRKLANKYLLKDSDVL